MLDSYRCPHDYILDICEECEANESSGLTEANSLLDQAEEALKRCLESGICEYDCEPDDLTCSTNYAKFVLAAIRGRKR